MRCPRCGARNHPNRTTCGRCGFEFKVQSPRIRRRPQQPEYYDDPWEQPAYQDVTDEPVKKKLLDRWWARIILAIAICFVILQVAVHFENKSKRADSFNIPRAEYVAACSTISHQDIMRNPDNFKNARLAITGKVMQIIHDGGVTAFRVAEDYEFDLSDKDSTLFERVWLVVYDQPKENRILENDIVTFYGDFIGIQEVTSIFNQQLHIPSVQGRFHELATDRKVISTQTSKSTRQTTASTDSADLKIGEIGKAGDMQVALQYVKRMSYLPTALSEEEVVSGNEVIIGFFEFYNGAKKAQTVSPHKITCYADGKQVGDVETYIKVLVDGVKEFYHEDIEPGCGMLTCQNFEVSKGWEELKFFYNSDCIWILKQEDVKAEPYQYTRLIDSAIAREPTELNEVIYSKDFEVVYRGYEFFYKSTFSENKLYVVFKFSLNNTGSEPLDTGFVGHKMRAYQDYVFLGDAAMFLSEKFDGHINVFDIDSVEPGMSANIYVAFEARDIEASLYMIYDDGFIASNVRGEVFIE